MRSSHGYKYLQITKLFSSLPSTYLMSETTRQNDFQVLSRFHTSLPTTKTPATAHIVLIASTTMACSLSTLCRLADASRSSAIFRSSLPTEMHALRCDGDSSDDRKSVDAIQILALWKQDILIFTTNLLYLRFRTYSPSGGLIWSGARSCQTHDFIASVKLNFD